MYELKVKGHFDAAHSLRNYPGKCSNLHGHSWKYEISLSGESLNELGMLIDFKEVKELMVKHIESILDHTYINQTHFFETKNPTAENISFFIFKSFGYEISYMKPVLILNKVTVWESNDCSVTYTE